MAFALEIQGGLVNLAGGPADEYYQFRNPDTGVYRAYATNAEAAALVPAAARAFRTVLVAGVEKWWLPADLSNAGLAVKTSDVAGVLVSPIPVPVQTAVIAAAYDEFNCITAAAMSTVPAGSVLTMQFVHGHWAYSCLAMPNTGGLLGWRRAATLPATATPQATNAVLGTTRGNGFAGAIGNVVMNSDGTMTAPAAPGTAGVTSFNNRTGAVTATKTDVGLGSVTDDAQVKRSEVGVAGGVAPLAADNKVPAVHLPAPRALYAAAGQATDGSMDQKSVTDLLTAAVGQTNAVGARVTLLENNPLPTIVARSLNGAVTYQGDNFNSSLATGNFGDIVFFLKPVMNASGILAGGSYINGNNYILEMNGFTLTHREASRVLNLVAQNGVISATAPGVFGGPTVFIGGLRQALQHRAVPGAIVRLEDVEFISTDAFVRFAGGGTFILTGTTSRPLPAQIEAGTTVLIKTPDETLSPLPYAANLTIDFNTDTVRTINAGAAGIAYGPSANIVPLRKKEHYITNATGADIPLSFPLGWKFAEKARPTVLAAGKEAVLTVISLGTTDATVKAAYAVFS